MFYILDDKNKEYYFKNGSFHSNAKEAVREYEEMLESGRKVQARIFEYANGDEQLRIYEYDKQKRRYALIKKIYID